MIFTAFLLVFNFFVYPACASDNVDERVHVLETNQAVLDSKVKQNSVEIHRNGMSIEKLSLKAEKAFHAFGEKLQGLKSDAILLAKNDAVVLGIMDKGFMVLVTGFGALLGGGYLFQKSRQKRKCRECKSEK